MNVRRALLVLLLAVPVAAQSLRLLSEFQRVDPFGGVVPADRTPSPREILSPEVARNAFASFRIAVVDMPERSPFFLYVQTNPENAFQISLYKELYVKTEAGWIPDALEPMKLPAFGSLPYLPTPIPGQNTVSYWMDVWVPADAPVRRVRLEVLLKVGRGWVVYPLEVRVMPAVAPPARARHAALPPASARADTALAGPFRAFICNAHEGGRDERLSVRRLIHRNGLQDMSLARQFAARRKSDLRAELLDHAGVRDRTAWCQPSETMPVADAEWFLRVRNFLYRMAGPAPD